MTAFRRTRTDFGALGDPVCRFSRRVRRLAGSGNYGADTHGAAFLPCRHTFFLKKGERLELDKLRAQLTLGGYQHVTQVVAPGEFSVRGGLVDLFPMERPCLTASTCSTRKSKAYAPSMSITSVPLSGPGNPHLAGARIPARRSGAHVFPPAFPRNFRGDASRVTLYKDVSNGVAPAGIEYYLPCSSSRRHAVRLSAAGCRAAPAS